TATYNGHFADPTELMHGRQSADNSAIFNDDVAGQCGDIRHYYVVGQPDIMSDMRVGQDVIIVANDCRVAIAGGAVDCHIFAESVVVSDASVGGAATPFEVLRVQAEA